MVNSMTGYASATGAEAGLTWGAEMKSVNARGLDLRLRVPDWIEGLEPALRSLLAGVAARGNVTLTLRVHRDEASGAAGLDPAALARALGLVSEIEAAARAGGVALAPTSAADLMGVKGVLDGGGGTEDTAPLREALLAGLAPMAEAFKQARAEEGAALGAVLSDQINQIETLVTDAEAAVAARSDEMAANFRAALAKVTEAVEVDETRVAQELAVLAVKADVTEELDRLRAHIAAARELLAAKGPVGRKLDFLSQEFNREANTLCAKSQSTALTRVGLDLKATIDQMREQVQNVE